MLRHVSVVISFSASITNIGGNVVNDQEVLADAIVFANPPTTDSSRLTEVTSIAFHVSLLFDFVHRDHLPTFQSNPSKTRSIFSGVRFPS